MLSPRRWSKTLFLFVVRLAPCFASLPLSTVAHGQAFTSFEQAQGKEVKDLGQELTDKLDDPLFRLVLKDKPNATTLSEVENLLQPDASQRRVFVVSEDLADNTPTGARRTVIAFLGQNRGTDLSGNVMLSTSFTASRFAESFVEAWGWDNAHARYNYYRLDTEGTSDGKPSWKFHGTSERADSLTAAERVSCMQCHINGAPLMKELFFPWNNWHSPIAFVATYLKGETQSTSTWPVARQDRLLGHLGGAEQLEGMIIESITKFNNSILDQHVSAADSKGLHTVNNAPRLLKHLFETTEVNLASSQHRSGRHPLARDDKAGARIQLPPAFFLNARLFGGDQIAGYQGLGVTGVNEFDDISIPTEEYHAAIKSSGQRWGGRSGDTLFAWFIPEASHVDNSMVDLMVRRGIITREFAAAALAVDLENPVFSKERGRLLALVPESFTFISPNPDIVSRHPDELTTAVIRALESSNPTDESPERKFLDLLKSSNPIEEVNSRVKVYADHTRTSLSEMSTTAATVRMLHKRSNERKAAMMANDLLRHLNEADDRLLPIP